MPVINCPGCNKGLRLPDQAVGQQFQCPHCKNTFAAPNLAAHITTKPGPPPVPRDDEGEAQDRPTRRRRRFRDEDDSDDDLDIRRGALAPHRGATILTLGILSVVICGPIMGPIAWIMGSNDLKEMRAGRMDPSGEGTTRAGQILGMVMSILAIVLICFYAIVIVIAAANRN